MSQLGRISGGLLNDVLNRDGVDLSFETNLLYLDVTNGKIGINQPGGVPSFDLDILGYTKTTDLEVVNQATIDNVVFLAGGTISTVSGPIVIAPRDTSSPYVNLSKVLTGQLELNNNEIRNYQLNGSIILDPNAAGTVDIEDTTNVTGNLNVSGSINVPGNLSAVENIIVGDSKLDVVVIAPDLTQDIIPGIDLDYDLGADAGDSSPRRWAELYVRDNLTNANNVVPLIINVSDQLRIDMNNRQILALQSNDDVVINSDTGLIYTEDLKWSASQISNQLNTPLILASTGNGYLRFSGTNAVVIPAGTNAERNLTSEVGDTRWNTELGYMECFDGSVWVIATGPGAVITQENMEDLGHIYTLMLG